MVEARWFLAASLLYSICEENRGLSGSPTGKARSAKVEFSRTLIRGGSHEELELGVARLS